MKIASYACPAFIDLFSSLQDLFIFTIQGPDLQNILRLIKRLSYVYRTIDVLRFLLGISQANSKQKQ